jgi:UDP-glucose 4-epimerase
VSIFLSSDELAELTGYKGSPNHTEARAGDVRDSFADITAATTNLGWNPSVSLDEGLARTVEYFAGAKTEEG